MFEINLISKKMNLYLFFILNFILIFILGIINYFMTKNFLFLICLTSILITYPCVNFLFKEYFFYDKKKENRTLLEIEVFDVLVFSFFFLSCFFSFLAILKLGLIEDFSYISLIVSNITGNFIFFDKTFFQILINNLIVAFFTFLISFITCSGFVLTIIFNAAIFSVFIFEAGKKGILLFFLTLPHAFFEIMGFILAGIFGFILSQKITNRFFNKDLNLKIKQNNFQTFLILVFSILSILIGAIIEIL